MKRSLRSTTLLDVVLFALTALLVVAIAAYLYYGSHPPTVTCRLLDAKLGEAVVGWGNHTVKFKALGAWLADSTLYIKLGVAISNACTGFTGLHERSTRVAEGSVTVELTTSLVVTTGSCSLPGLAYNTTLPVKLPKLNAGDWKLRVLVVTGNSSSTLLSGVVTCS